MSLKRSVAMAKTTLELEQELFTSKEIAQLLSRDIAVVKKINDELRLLVVKHVAKINMLNRIIYILKKATP